MPSLSGSGVAYQVRLRPAAQKDLRRIPERDLGRLRQAMEGLAPDARPPGSVKLRDTERAYRLRVGQYRIIYEVHEAEGVVRVMRVRRRTESTYRQLRP